MRIRVFAAAVLLVCGSLAARAEDSPVASPDNAPAAPPQVQATTPKQSLERAPANSQIEKSAEQPSGRFSFYRVDGGFLRFDTQSGQIAYCNSQNASWACEAVPENRAALEKEIEQLRAEVTELKNQLKAQEEPPRPPRPIPAPPQTSPPTAAPPPSGDSMALPGREEFARAASALQEAWRHFVDLVIALKNDVLRKS
jgi:hypothetical protein